MGHPLCLQRSVRLSVEEICSVGDSTRRGKRSEAKFEQTQYSTVFRFLVLGAWFWVLVQGSSQPGAAMRPRTYFPISTSAILFTPLSASARLPSFVTLTLR